jgi:hypothetical protein
VLAPLQEGVPSFGPSSVLLALGYCYKEPKELFHRLAAFRGLAQLNLLLARKPFYPLHTSNENEFCFKDIIKPLGWEIPNQTNSFKCGRAILGT